MKIVYIAGPYTGNESETFANIMLAREYAKKLAAKGIGFICPHSNSAHMENITKHEFWTRMYLEIIPKCDAIYFLPGWERSEGSKKELVLAENLGLPTFFALSKLFKWAKGRR